MKTRNGFVSNSSSSSFIIAALKDEFLEKCSCCGQMPLNFLESLKNVPNPSVAYQCQEMESFVDNTDEEIKEIEEDREWLKKELAMYQDIAENENFSLVAEKILKAIESEVERKRQKNDTYVSQTYKLNAEIVHDARSGKYSSESGYTRAIVSDKIRDLQWGISKIDSEIVRLKNLISELEPLLSEKEKWNLYGKRLGI